MTTEKLTIVENTGATLIRSGDTQETVKVKGHYDVVCMRDGVVAWEDAIENLVVNVGKNDLLDKYFAGSTYTAAWYMGFVDGASTPTYNAADTLASHAGWTENTAYTGTDRVTVAWNAASAGSKASTSTSFSINGTATIAGAILTQTQAKATTTGILYSAGSFTGGSRSVISGDIILVVFTASV